MKYIDFSIKQYLNALSSYKAVPGGGSATAVLASMAIALNQMVAGIMLKNTIGDTRKEIKDIREDFNTLHKAVRKIIDKDATVYNKVIKAYKIPKKDKSRIKKIEKALLDSFVIMRNLASDLIVANKLAMELKAYTRGAIANDILVSQNFMQASFNSAIATAMINIKYMKCEDNIKKCSAEIKEIKKLFK